MTNSNEYIQPDLNIFKDIEEALSSEEDSFSSYFDREKGWSFEDLLDQIHVIILGQPGTGKTRLLYDVKIK